MTACLTLGISPRRYCGWEPEKWHEPGTGGRVRVVREPEWDWVDRAIIGAWQHLQTSLCIRCGRPWAAHDTDRPEDYNVGFQTCTATTAIDRAQAKKHVEDAAELKAGRNPERARMWLAWTEQEGPPTFT